MKMITTTRKEIGTRLIVMTTDNDMITTTNKGIGTRLIVMTTDNDMIDTSSTIHAPTAGSCREAPPAALQLRRPRLHGGTVGWLGGERPQTHQPTVEARAKKDRLQT